MCWFWKFRRIAINDLLNFSCCGRTTVENGAAGGLFLGCFFGLGLVASVGCVLKSAGKCWEVKKSAGK
jgi:hypothetical protein